MLQSMTKHHICVLLGILISGVTYLSLGSNLLSLYVVPIQESLNISRAAVSTMFTTLAISTMALSPFAFKVFKVIKIKTLYILGGFISLAGMLLMAFGGNIVLICVGTAILGVGGFTNAFLTGGTLIAKWFTKSKGLMVGLMGASGSFGSVILSPVLGNIITNHGWQTALVISGIVICASVSLSGLILIRDDPAECSLKAYGEPLDEATSAAAAVKPTMELPGMTLAEAKKTSLFYAVIAAALLSTIAQQGIATQQSAMIMDKGFSMEQAALVVSVYSFVSMINKVLSGVITDKFGLGVSALYCGGGLIAAALLMLFTSSYTTMIAFGAMFGLWGAIISNFTMLANTTLFERKEIGAIQGFSSSAQGVGSMIGPAVSGLAFSSVGNYSVFMWITIGITVAFLAICLVVTNPKNAYANRCGK